MLFWLFLIWLFPDEEYPDDTFEDGTCYPQMGMPCAGTFEP